MEKIKNLTIRKKIVITALILIFILAAAKFYELAFIEKLENLVILNLDKNWNSLQYSKDVESSFYLSVAATSNYALTSDKTWIDIEKESQEHFKKSLVNLKNNYNYPDDFNKTIAEIESSSAVFYQNLNQVISNKSNPGNINAFLKNNNGNILKITYKCKELVAYAQRFISDNNNVIQTVFKNTQLVSLSAAVLSVLILLVFIYLQLRFLLQPLGELLNGIKLIWAGDTEHRISIKTQDEIGELAKVFNYMAGSIQREQKRLFEKATTDEMTGLFNFRYFQDSIEKEFEKAARFNHNLSFIIMDVDFFKFYNDNNGHQAGDQVLKAIASVVTNSCRDKDIPARYGGEEFVVILPNTPLEPATKVADRIRKAVEETPIIYQEKQPNKNLTISLGVSNYPLNANNAKDLIEYADNALYEAKSSGKNKVCIAKEKNN